MTYFEVLPGRKYFRLKTQAKVSALILQNVDISYYKRRSSSEKK